MAWARRPSQKETTRTYEQKQVIEALRRVTEPLRKLHDYPHIKVNAAYLIYDLCQELNIPEHQVSRLLGFRGYLHLARTRYYATPEGTAALEEALHARADPFQEEAANE